MKFRSVSCLLSLSWCQDRESAQWPGPNQFNTTLLHLAERQKEDLLSTESSAQSCDMIGIVNVVTLQQWSQRLRGMDWWREKVCGHVPSSTAPPPPLLLFLLLSFLLAVIPSLLCSLVKDSSLCKFDQTAWIKAIIQFVYMASFILCQASAPLTIRGLLTPDLCWGHIYNIVQRESFRLLSGDKGLKMHDENPIIQICATL